MIENGGLVGDVAVIRIRGQCGHWPRGYTAQKTADTSDPHQDLDEIVRARVVSVNCWKITFNA